MPAPHQSRIPSPLLLALLAQDTLESLYAEHGSQRPWTYWLVLFGVIAALASLPFIKVNVSVRATGLVRPTTERTEIRSAVSGRITEVLTHDNDRVRFGQPLLVISSRDLEERLSRNREMQAQHGDLISDLQFLTTEPVVATDGPSGDTVGKGGTTGPLSTPSLLYGSSVVKSFFQTSALQQERIRFSTQQASDRVTETKARNELVAAPSSKPKASLLDRLWRAHAVRSIVWKRHLVSFAQSFSQLLDWSNRRLYGSLWFYGKLGSESFPEQLREWRRSIN